MDYNSLMLSDDRQLLSRISLYDGDDVVTFNVGTYGFTTDETIDSSKTYYYKTASGTFKIVANPTQEDLPLYYEKTITETEYIDDYNLIQSFSIEDSLVGGNADNPYLSFGCACSGALTLNLIYPKGDDYDEFKSLLTKGRKLKVELGVYDTDTQAYLYNPIGVYFVDSIETTTNNKTCTVIALDGLSVGNINNQYNLGNWRESGAFYSVTEQGRTSYILNAYALIKWMIEKASLNFGIHDYTHSYEKTVSPKVEYFLDYEMPNMTYREIIACIAGHFSGNAIIDSGGDIKIVKFRNQISTVISNKHITNCIKSVELANVDYVQVFRLNIDYPDDLDGYETGELIEDNYPTLPSRDELNAVSFNDQMYFGDIYQFTAQSIYSELENAGMLAYNEIECTWKGNPTYPFDLGNVITVELDTDEDGEYEYYKLPIMYRLITYTGGLNMVIRSYGLAPTEQVITENNTTSSDIIESQFVDANTIKVSLITDADGNEIIRSHSESGMTRIGRSNIVENDSTTGVFGTTTRIVGKNKTGGNSGGLRLNLAYVEDGQVYYDGNATIQFFSTESSGVPYFIPTANNTIYLGSSNYKWHSVYCADGTFNGSDRKIKENIAEFDSDKVKDYIMGLTPVTYTLKNGEGKRTHCGFVAQDVSKNAQETLGDLAVYQATVVNDDGSEGYYDKSVSDDKLNWSLNYAEFIAPLVAVVQQQQAEIDDLRTELSKLSNDK